MVGEWKVTSNPINGETLYGVIRLRDKNGIDHSGNRELYGSYLTSRSAAEDLAKELNEKEKDK